MSLTRSIARDEILDRLKEVWDSSEYSDWPILWDDTEGDPPLEPESDEVGPMGFLRATCNHGIGGQGSLAGAAGNQMWDSLGLLIVQIFTPAGSGLSLSDTLASIILNAYRGYSTPGGVWFRNHRANEVGASGPWFQVNVIIEFEYTEVS